MAYSKIDDIREHMPEEEMLRLTDDEGLGEIVESRVDAAISGADALIDAYCGVKYKVPILFPLKILNSLSVDIAIYGLYSRVVAEVPESRSERYRSAVKFLEGISSGNITLGVNGTSGVPEADNGADYCRGTNCNVFSRCSMEGY